MTPRGFWPQPLTQLEPPPRKSVHCDGIGIDGDGRKYAVKFALRHPRLPATEAICHGIAEACGVDVPVWSPVEWNDAIGFGSHWFVNALQDSDPRWSRYWIGPEPTLSKAFFGRCCAVDGFLANRDRHFGNFLLVDGKRVNVMPFAGDYSCAWWMARWQPDELLPPGCNSAKIYKQLFQKGAVELAEAKLALQSLATLDGTAIARMMESLPASWYSAECLESFLEWWTGPSRLQRIERLQDLIKRGQLPL